MIHTLKELFRDFTGKEADSVFPLGPSGSNRSYYRLTGGNFSLIGVAGTCAEENRAFFYIDSQLRLKNIPVPEVYAISKDNLCYLQQDLGDTSLFQLWMKAREAKPMDEECHRLLQQTMRLLPDIQYAGATDFDFNLCHPSPRFSKRCILWDFYYFKYCFLKGTGMEFQEEKLEDDFERFATLLLQDEGKSTFLYRDFQSRNIMIHDGKPWFIDFQGGRKGPIEYDVASFLWQARAGYSDELRQELLAIYLESLRNYQPVDAVLFKRRLNYFILFRMLQVLGAYGYRGNFERKPHFLQSIPLAIANLQKLLENDFPEFPYLCGLLKQMVQLDKFKVPAASDILTIRIVSFSYPKGIPEDPSGNGGGFVFDCRGLHNPGRYEAYRNFTGKDRPVIRFLEEQGEMDPFLAHVYALVDSTVENYLTRNFKNLMVCFGCTGGQHRSVYAAEHLAQHLRQLYQVKIIVIHREQSETYTI